MNAFFVRGLAHHDRPSAVVEVVRGEACEARKRGAVTTNTVSPASVMPG